MSADMTAAECGAVTVRFLLEAEPCPGLLPRILQPFAKRHLVPDDVRSQRVADDLLIDVLMEAVSATVAQLIEGNLRQIVGVRRVTQVRPVPLRQVA